MRRIVVREDNGDLTEGLSVTQIVILLMYLRAKREEKECLVLDLHKRI